MKPALVEREVHSSGVMTSASFGISQENQVHILGILRDTLYSNKTLAVLREYAANGMDAHVEAGKADQPIKVVLPTELESSLIIRDFGPGLTEREIFQVYTQYGASTKRGSNSSIGMLGIGSKSAFAYNDSFSITSFNGGLKRVYHAVLDKTNMGIVMKVHEAALGSFISAFKEQEGLEGKELIPNEYYQLQELLSEDDLPLFLDWVLFCEGAETGIEIKVPVNPGDISLFHKEAAKLFRYFRPMPDINIQLVAPISTWYTKSGFLRRLHEHRYEDDWIAVMGCIPYRLNMGQITKELEAAGLSDLMSNLRGGIYFEIGEVDISANREELEYKQRTKDAIVARFQRLIEDLTGELDQLLLDPSLTNWQKRMKLLDFRNKTGIPLTAKYAQWRDIGFVTLYSDKPVKDALNRPVRDDEGNLLMEGRPKSFILKGVVQTYSSRKKLNLEENPKIPLSQGSRILIRDSLRPLKGYINRSHSDSDRVVTIRSGFSLADVQQELNGLLVESRLDGLLILKMSDMDYQLPDGTLSLRLNTKHREKCFRLVSCNARRKSPSDNWVVADRFPEADDIYVVINRFEPLNHQNFFSEVERDTKLLKNLFNAEMPPIYGIKTTQRSPIKEEDIEGTPYKEWRTDFFKEAMSLFPELSKLLLARNWSSICVGTGGWNRSTDEDVYKFLSQNLDGRHRLVRFFSEKIQAHNFLRSNRGKSDSLSHLANFFPQGEAEKAFKRILDVYPLLAPGVGSQYGLAVLGAKETQEPWLQYVNLIDSSRGK